MLGTSLEEAERILVERRKEEAVASGASTRAIEHLRTARKQLRGLEIQSTEMVKQLEDKQHAAADAAGTEFKALEEAAKEAQEALTEAQANLAVSFSFSFVIFKFIHARLLVTFVYMIPVPLVNAFDFCVC